MCHICVLLLLLGNLLLLLFLIIMKICPASFRETFQWSNFPLVGYGLRAGGRIPTFSLWTGLFRDTLGQITKQMHKLLRS